VKRRRFNPKDLEDLLAKFKGQCRMCLVEIGGGTGLEWDHRIPLAIGGDDELTNLEPLCRKCHRLKTNGDMATIAKTRRQRQDHLGIKNPNRRRMPGSRDSNVKIKMDGTRVDRRTGERL
jgi:5-methylcytosine-specific restriction protein A